MMFVIITISSASYVRYQYLFSQVVMFGNSIIEWWAEPLPIVTKAVDHTKRTMSKGWGDAYQTLPELWVPFARGAKPIGDFGLVYHRLPILRSEFEPAEVMLYQSLPPHRRHNTHLIRVCVIWCYNDLVIKHSDWLWLGPNLTSNLIDAWCNRLWLGHMFWTWCGQGCGTCDAQSMTCERHRTLDLGRLV